MKPLDIAKGMANYFFDFPDNHYKTYSRFINECYTDPEKTRILKNKSTIKHLFTGVKNGLNIADVYLAFSVLFETKRIDEGIVAIGTLEVYRLLINGVQWLEKGIDNAQRRETLAKLNKLDDLVDSKKR